MNTVRLFAVPLCEEEVAGGSPGGPEKLLLPEGDQSALPLAGEGVVDMEHAVIPQDPGIAQAHFFGQVLPSRSLQGQAEDELGGHDDAAAGEAMVEIGAVHTLGGEAVIRDEPVLPDEVHGLVQDLLGQTVPQDQRAEHGQTQGVRLLPCPGIPPGCPFRNTRLFCSALPVVFLSYMNFININPDNLV